jgi:serine/threonine protein phosphatase 1
MGDVHGAYKALKQCLIRADFDYENDVLINLGDVCDGWPETKSCIYELMKIKNLTYILGNHDLWTLEWMKTGSPDDLWLRQGGAATVNSYKDGVPTEHLLFLENALSYAVSNNKLFVHAGFNPLLSMNQQDADVFLWDRTLAHSAMAHYGQQKHRKLTTFDEVFIGHTPIPFNKPVQGCEVWLMDTGAGWAGVLSMMEIDSKEIFVSDPVPSLYPGITGRMRSA